MWLWQGRLQGFQTETITPAIPAPSWDCARGAPVASSQGGRAHQARAALLAPSKGGENGDSPPPILGAWALVSSQHSKGR